MALLGNQLPLSPKSGLAGDALYTGCCSPVYEDCAKVGPAISVTKARAAMRAFMIHLHIADDRPWVLQLREADGQRFADIHEIPSS
jgi:hypothetical protein